MIEILLSALARSVLVVTSIPQRNRNLSIGARRGDLVHLLVRTIPDRPKAGIQVRDFTTQVRESMGLDAALDELCSQQRSSDGCIAAVIEESGGPLRCDGFRTASGADSFRS